MVLLAAQLGYVLLHPFYHPNKGSGLNRAGVNSLLVVAARVPCDSGLSRGRFCGDVPDDQLDIDVVSVGVEGQTLLDLKARAVTCLNV